MKVVILQDGTAARFVSEDESTYTCEIQDSFPVPKEEARVELWSAASGKGIIYLKEPGFRPSYSDPGPASAIVLDLIYEEGCVPETYSCSMLSSALVNIVNIYPEKKGNSLSAIDSLIKIVMSPELRRYDADRWGEDPLESLDGDNSHISYLSHLAWMIGGYKLIGGSHQYDRLFDSLCSTMYRRL